MNERQGVALVVCAPSGAGKTTLIKRLMAEFPALAFSISCTTRPPRPKEMDGKDYYFVSSATFMQHINSGYFAEWAIVHGNYYGTPLTPTLHALAQGQDVIFDVDVQGAAQLQLTLPKASYIYILPPSMGVLRQRLLERASDDAEAIDRRMRNAVKEIQEAHWFDAWIVNADLDTAYDNFRASYIYSTLAPRQRPHLLRQYVAE